MLICFKRASLLCRLSSRLISFFSPNLRGSFPPQDSASLRILVETFLRWANRILSDPFSGNIAFCFAKISSLLKFLYSSKFVGTGLPPIYYGFFNALAIFILSWFTGQLAFSSFFGSLSWEWSDSRREWFEWPALECTESMLGLLWSSCCFLWGEGEFCWTLSKLLLNRLTPFRISFILFASCLEHELEGDRG